MLIALGDVYAQIPDLDRVRALMRATQERVREEPGCIGYVFAETVEDPGHFVIVQQWRDQAALDQHYGSQAFADYQAQIANSLVRTSELRIHAVKASYAPFDSAPIGPPEVD
jgi:quinol monooxygenase YgiN